MNETKNETNRSLGTCGEGQAGQPDRPLPGREVEFARSRSARGRGQAEHVGHGKAGQFTTSVMLTEHCGSLSSPGSVFR
jgi:hypothetical protein